ncbi:ASCH domain-containing protein [Hafnia alvei]|uniref:ASCH domain-containing protein n=1 Tax=Hafnia alvei TaxID=569 RepID=UPI0011EC4A59|nr:ASCH domain-containing protein [Hafnia alvei]KAA0259852.1 ASCH domain-containing protein [Hafnia alvei]
MKAISIRQPWAWLIVNGYKDIENRSWRTKYRGPVLIHASQGVKSIEYVRACNLIHQKLHEHGIPLPPIDQLQTGGIVGIATITDCVEESDSPWFFGEKGFVLADAKTLPFISMKGKLSFFETGIEPLLVSSADPEPPEAA